jgi:tetratricopeptide (TPR) repeat protein
LHLQDSDNNERQIVSGRDALPCDDAIQYVVLHLSQWTQGSFSHDFAQPLDAERLLLRAEAFAKAVRVDDQAIPGLQWNFDRGFSAYRFSHQSEGATLRFQQSRPRSRLQDHRRWMTRPGEFQNSPIPFYASGCKRISRHCPAFPACHTLWPIPTPVGMPGGGRVGRKKPARARDFGAGFARFSEVGLSRSGVFEGRVNQRGGTVNISAELIDARDNSHIWGEQYSRKSDDIFALQGEIAREMTAALRIRLTGEDEKRVAEGYTPNPDAYQDYLKGLYWLNKRSGESNKGIQYFHQAISKDPAYALVYSGLAGCYFLLAVYGLLPTKEVHPKTRLAALKSLELDDTLADAHASLAWIKAWYDWDWSGSEKEIQQALLLNPRDAYTHDVRGITLSNMGLFDLAFPEYKRALELDPHSIFINRVLGLALYASRQYDRAIEQSRNTLEMDSSSLFSHRSLG